MRTIVLCGVGLIVGVAGCGPIQRAQNAAYAEERTAQANAEMAACVKGFGCRPVVTYPAVGRAGVL